MWKKNFTSSSLLPQPLTQTINNTFGLCCIEQCLRMLGNSFHKPGNTKHGREVAVNRCAMATSIEQKVRASKNMKTSGFPCLTAYSRYAPKAPVGLLKHWQRWSVCPSISGCSWPYVLEVKIVLILDVIVWPGQQRCDGAGSTCGDSVLEYNSQTSEHAQE